MPDAAAATSGFATVAQALAGHDGVTVGSGRRGFGADALQVDGRIFAMASRGRMVLKLPSHRVAALLAAGSGIGFDAGKGRPMKEWVALQPATQKRALALALEALAFVAGRAI